MVMSGHGPSRLGRIPRISLPIAGPLFLLDPLRLLARSRRVGDVCLLELGFANVVAINHPEHARHVLRDGHANYVREGPVWSSVRDLLGDGLPAAEGELWRRQRRLMQPHFYKQSLEALCTVIVETIEQSLEWADVGREWAILNLGLRISHMTTNVASAALLGLPTSRPQTKVLAHACETAVDGMLAAMVVRRLPAWLPTPRLGRFDHAIRSIRTIVAETVAERQQSADGSADLLASLIAASKSGDEPRMSEKQLLDEVQSLYLAGFATTAAGLQWSLYFLARHPEHMRRIRAQADAVFGGRNPVASDLSKLTYARWVMQEALRLYPASWWIPRSVREDDVIGGYPIGAGMTVAPAPFSIHRHPDFWERPECFDPERFDPSRARRRHALAWIPFGTGAKKCIGQELALMEAQLALSMISQRFEIALDPHHPVKPRVTTLLRPAGGVTLKVRRRSGSPMLG